MSNLSSKPRRNKPDADGDFSECGRLRYCRHTDTWQFAEDFLRDHDPTTGEHYLDQKRRLARERELWLIWYFNAPDSPLLRGKYR